MANIERASEQLDAIRNGFDNSNHSLVKKISDGIIKRIGEECDIKMSQTAKESTVGHIKMDIVGQKVINENELAELDDKVRRFIDQLKNPVSLLNIME